MQNTRLIKAAARAMALLALTACVNEHAQTEAASAASSDVTPEEARAIAKEAYIYANPLVDAYRAMYSWFLDEQSPEFKAPLNRIGNVPRVFTPEDRAVQGPNSDTPYSFLGLDLRTDPIVLTVPKIEEGR